MATAAVAHGNVDPSDDEVIDVPNAEGVVAGYRYDEEEENLDAIVVEDAPLLPADQENRPGSATDWQECAEQPGVVYAGVSETGAPAAATAAVLAAPVPPGELAVSAAPAVAGALGDAPQPIDHIAPQTATHDDVEVLEIPNRTGTPVKRSRAAGRVAGKPAAVVPIAAACDDDEDDDADDGWGDTEVPGVVSVDDAMTTRLTTRAVPEQDWEEIAARVRGSLDQLRVSSDDLQCC